MKRLNKKYLAVVFTVCLFIFLALPFVSEQQSVSAQVQDTQCKNAGGVCQNTSNSCPGGYLSGYCPSSGASVKCCRITQDTQCKNIGGVCQNTSVACASGYLNNYCPSGSSLVKCCVLPTATHTPTPTPTGTPTPTPTNTPTPTPTGTPETGSTTTPGIIFSGDIPADFGSSLPSETGWVAGGSEYPEVFSQNINPSPLSYQKVYGKATRAKLITTSADMAKLSGCTNLSSCTLPAVQHGIYVAKGDVTLNAHTFLANSNYVFLIDGNLTIAGNIITPTGSMVLFISSKDIVINRTVGSPTNSYPLPAAQLQALFIANDNFTVDGIGDCTAGTDRMLNIEGAIVANSGGSAEGFRNFRDLCAFNSTIPSVTIKPRLDFLLNAPEFIMTTNTTFREIR